MKRTICFFYPSHLLGGAELLFARCANYFVDKGGFEVLYVDYKDGYIQKYINKEVNLIEYRNGEMVSLPKNSIVVLQLNRIRTFCKDIENSSTNKYLFWSINPDNLTSLIEVIEGRIYTVTKKKRKFIGEKIKGLLDKGVVRFMDHNNLYINSKVFHFQPNNCNYLPIAIDNFSLPQNYKNGITKGAISFLWLGRLDKDKYNTILTFFYELEYLAKYTNIILYVVGSGTLQKKLEQISKKFSFKTLYLGRLRGANLDQLIDESVDIGLAMGLSSLEIAKRGKPVILQGFLKKKCKANERKDFICLNEIKDYDVVSPGYFIKDPVHSFKEIVDMIIADYYSYSKACAELVKRDFTMGNVGEKLEDAIYKVDSCCDNFAYSDLLSISDVLKESFLKSYIRRGIRKILYLISTI